MALVEVIDVARQFVSGEETIRPLDGVSLTVEEGDFVSLMGASGSGKSTLLNCVAGIDPVNSGQIIVGGTDITKLSRGKLADWRAAHVGYIFQTHNLIPVLTAYENVELPLLLLSMSGAERRKRVEISLAAVDLTNRADHYPRQMSGGQEQRVGIARAIVTDPTLLLCDEPTGDLDRKSGDDILNLLQALNREHNKTIIMVTHDPHASARASRTVYLNKGQLLSEKPAD